MAINSLSASSKGISGLASGMDTQSMVEQMLKGTQTKIDTKNQQKAVITYKQEMYRSVAAQIKAFQTQFFSFSKADTNLLSNQLFQSMNAVTNSKFLTAKASSSASAGKITINEIKSLARNHKEVSAGNATGELSGKFSSAAVQKIKDLITDPDKAKITVTVGEEAAAKTVEIALKDIVGKSAPDAVKVFNDAFAAAGINTKADYIDNRVVFENSDNLPMTIKGGENTSNVIGSVVSNGNQTTFALDTKAMLPKINVNVDGISKSISYNPFDIQGGETEQQSILRQLNSGIKSAFGSGITLEGDDVTGKISLKTTNASSKVTISGVDDAIAAIGFKNNSSNKISTTKSIRDVNFKTPLAGNMQKFSINGVDFSFSNGTSLTNIMGTINSSDAGVRVSYDSVRDKFMIESTNSGKLENTANGTPFEFKQTEGNMLSVMFGANSSDTFSSNGFKVEKMRESSVFDTSSFDFKSDSFSIQLTEGDKTTTYTISGITKGTDPAAVLADINAKLADTIKNEDGTPKVKFELTDLGGGKSEIKMVTSDPANIKAAIAGEGMADFGFSNKATGASYLSELGIDDFTMNINGRNVAVSGNMTLDDFTQLLKNEGVASEVSLETIGGTPFIRLAGVAIPMSFPEPAASKLFGTSIQPSDGEMPLTGAFSKDAKDGYVEGANAEAVINGVTVNRTTNSFSIDGVNLTLTGITSEEQTVDVSQDTEVIYNAVIKFVEEYNKLVNDINKLIDADPTHKKYPPLTTEQKNAMSDKEIELWEEKAKGGLLRGDNTLVTIQSSLRSTLYTKPDYNGVALYDLGITTDFFGTKDNLQISKPDELKRMISENPDAVRKLFTDPEKGLSTLMNKAMDRAASSGSTPGSLVQIAGSTGKTDTTSSIYRQMKSIDESIERLELKYEQEYNRYWKMFNAMEQQISQMNQQSGWLSQQFAS